MTIALISPKGFGHPQRLSHVTAGAFHELKIGMLTNGTQRIDIGISYTAHLYEASNLTGSTYARQGGDNKNRVNMSSTGIWKPYSVAGTADGLRAVRTA